MKCKAELMEGGKQKIKQVETNHERDAKEWQANLGKYYWWEVCNELEFSTYYVVKNSRHTLLKGGQINVIYI